MANENRVVERKMMMARLTEPLWGELGRSWHQFGILLAETGVIEERHNRSDFQTDVHSYVFPRLFDQNLGIFVAYENPARTNLGPAIRGVVLARRIPSGNKSEMQLVGGAKSINGISGNSIMADLARLATKWAIELQCALVRIPADRRDYCPALWRACYRNSVLEFRQTRGDLVWNLQV